MEILAKIRISEARSGHAHNRHEMGIVRATLWVCAVAVLVAALGFAFREHRASGARAAVAKEDARVLQTAIAEYAKDKGYAPHKLEDLVRDGYLKAIPSDSPPELEMH